MTPNKFVHRPLILASPIESGPDIREFQEHVNRRYGQLNIDRDIVEDGDFGSQTFDGGKEVALALGVVGDPQEKLDRGFISEGVQQLIRGSRDRTPEEDAAAKRRDDYRQELRRRYSKSAGEEAVAKGRKLIGVTEQPHGSNWGGKVEEFIKFTGYTGPVFWCGCYAAWVVVKLGGAKIPTRIRLGFAPSITADALAGSNGLKAVRAQDARPGDIACLWGGHHIEVIAEKPVNGSVRCIGGNTTKGGQSSNGGEVAENVRSLSDFDRGIVARPNWG